VVQLSNGTVLHCNIMTTAVFGYFSRTYTLSYSFSVTQILKAKLYGKTEKVQVDKIKIYFSSSWTDIARLLILSLQCHRWHKQHKNHRVEQYNVQTV